MDNKNVKRKSNCIFESLLKECTHEKLNKDLSHEEIQGICDILFIGEINLEITNTENRFGDRVINKNIFKRDCECEEAIKYMYRLSDTRAGEISIAPMKGHEEVPEYSIFANILFLITYEVTTTRVLNNSRFMDPQTGVPNLRAVKDKIVSLVKNGDYSDYIIIYANIQNFKYLNDCGGVECGDTAIVAYTRKLVALAEEDEAIGRLGGDHFIICVKRRNQSKIMHALAGITVSDLPNTGDRNFVLSCWAGVMISDNKKLSFDERMQCAVDAYTMAKTRLKQRVVFYNDKFKAKLDWSRNVRELLGKSISKQEVYPVFQAKVNMKTGKLVGFEALSRWKYQGRIISPSEYISILDNQGMIHNLDMYILMQTCECIKKWDDAGIDYPIISVNVSRKNLFIPNIEEIIHRITTTAGVEPSKLDIEITESATEDEFSRLLDFITKMRQYGYRISIDDFGVGYSSLSLLHTIDADVIKFDKSFADNICSSNKVEYIVESIVNYANKIGMTTIAEGVESKEQGKKLLDIGCECCQGFYYGEPLSFEEASEVIKNPNYKPITED